VSVAVRFVIGRSSAMDTHPGIVETTQLGPSLWNVELAGEHDLSTIPMITQAFRRVSESGTTVIVDVEKMRFVDSTVIGTLVNHANLGENILVVAPRNGHARRIFDLVGVGRVLPLFDTHDEALRAVPREDMPAG
jgi:anti-anti-sigma factor